MPRILKTAIVLSACLLLTALVVSWARGDAALAPMPVTVAASEPKTEAGEAANRFLAEYLSPAGGYFVQITDSHIGGGAEEIGSQGFFSDRHPSEHLRQLLTHLRSLDPAPDFLLVTGDLTDHGTPEELRRFREILREEWPFAAYFVRGNHDRDLAAFLDAMADRPECERRRMERTGYCYAFDYRGVRVLCVDSETYRQGSPQAQWIDRVVEAAGDRPVLPVSHRHVLPTGHPLVDKWGGAAIQPDAPELIAALRRARRLHPLLCGHVHYGCQTSLEGFVQLSLTSSFYGVEDLGDTTGPLRARLCHLRDGELEWTAVTDALGGTAMEWTPAKDSSSAE